MNDTAPRPSELPHLAEIFEKLRRGHHICAFDGELYRALDHHQAAFAELFAGLGFQLIVHHRGFFYFHAQGKPSDSAARMALFVMILVEDLSNRGQDVEQTLLGEPFDINELPHLASERHTRIMNEAGVHDIDDLGRVVAQLERFGFARRSGPSVFSFRPPACRFLDLCLEVLDDDDEEAEK